MDEQRNTKRVIIHFSTVTPAFLFSYVPVLLITRHLAGNKNSILHLYVRKSKNTDKGKKKKTKLTSFTPRNKLFPKPSFVRNSCL